MPNGSTSWEPRETQALKQDGFNFNTVEKYNSFTVEPDFQNYQPVITCLDNNNIGIYTGHSQKLILIHR